jgi:hypothetical protein
MHQETSDGFFPVLLAAPAPCSAKQFASCCSSESWGAPLLEQSMHQGYHSVK